MSKGLEALENIGFEPLYQNEDGSYWRVRDEDKEDFEIIEIELKALEIIKEKNIDVINLKSCFQFYYGNDEAGLEDYNKTKNKNSTSLTQEEYNLLKEVLL